MRTAPVAWSRSTRAASKSVTRAALRRDPLAIGNVEMVDLAGEGKLEVKVDPVRPLGEVRQACARLISQQDKAKVVPQVRHG